MQIIKIVGYTIYFLLTAFVVYLLWMNPTAENNLMQITTLGGSVLLAAISVYPYLKKDQITTFSNFVIFRDNQSGKVVSGKYNEPYDKAYMFAFNRSDGTGDLNQIYRTIPKESELDFVERAIVSQLMADFNIFSWDAEKINGNSIYDTGNIVSFPENGPIKIREIVKII